jgi:uncharacterized membrane protein
VDLAWLFPYILFLHVLGAIAAFGPAFAFPIMGAMGGKEPQHANFGTRVSAAISDRLVIPLAILQGVTGVLLIWISGRDLFAPTSRWLLLAIVLYAIALGYSLFIQRRHVRNIIDLTSAPPPPDAKGPPPGLPAEVTAVQRGGMLLTGLIVVIVFLMVVKPSLGG